MSVSVCIDVYTSVCYNFEALKSTSNYLAEFQQTLKLTLNFLFNYLYDIRGILPEININSLRSFPPGVSQTWWYLTIGFYGKHLTFLSN